MTIENQFYCRDAGERFLEKESVDLFIGHPPYYQAELELNGGDPSKQMQNAETVENYYERLAASLSHMEYALKPGGHIFLALDNAPVSLGFLPVIAGKTSLKLYDLRMWHHSSSDNGGNGTVLFAHLVQEDWHLDPGALQGSFVLTTPWEEAYVELQQYNQKYATVGAAPTGIYREMIQLFSKKGDVVCDLFAGCGTVQVVALEYGRKFIYNDVSEDKVVMARKRIKDYLLARGDSSHAE